MIVLSLQFIFCSALIIVCGANLTKYGDVIAEKSGLGGAWIGLFLMASVTSLPELITGISSVTLAGVPNIALGDVMGSCVFNLLILSILDILNGKKPVFSKVEKGHTLSAGFGAALIGIAVISVLANEYVPVIGHIGIYTPVIVLLYGFGIRRIFFFEMKIRDGLKGVASELPAAHYEKVSTKEAVIKYILNALVIVGVAAWLPFIGDRLADETGLGKSFIGSIFIATTTSLPELVVSVSALKIGATDMAVANIFGSNMFDIFILAVDDLFYTKGSLLAFVSTNHAITGIMAILMTGIAIAGLTYRVKKKVFLRLGWDTLAILLTYFVNIFILYYLRGKG